MGKEVTGEIASEELATNFAHLLATPGEGAPKGYLALLLGKDVTRDDFDGRTSFFGEVAGSGPALTGNIEFG